MVERIHVDTSNTIREDGGPPKLHSKRLIDFLDFQWKASHMATDAALKSEDHGPRHWRDVARIGLTIGKGNNLTGEELAGVFCFAAIHDTQRQSEFRDPYHGDRAAALMMALATDQHQVVLGEFRLRCREALVGHDKGELSSDPLVGTCWDADRLTLPRVGITPMVEYMSTEFVRYDFDRAVMYANAVRLGPDEGWSDIATAYAEMT